MANCTGQSVDATFGHGIVGGGIRSETAAIALTISFAALYYIGTRVKKRDVYLLNFACYKPPTSLQIPLSLAVHGMQNFQIDPDGPIGIDEESIAFQDRISRTNGVSDTAYSSPWMHSGKFPLWETLGGETCYEAATRETRMVLFGAVRELLEKTGVRPKDIDFIVVNSSLFNPSPSMADLVVEHFGMRPDVQQFFLAGMGCSAGIISIDLASHLLGLNKEKYALVLCTENLTQNWYRGADRDKQIPNTLFRMGGSATLLTNKSSERNRCKYVLEHVVKVHHGADPTSYRCVYQMEDSEHIRAVQLTKDIVKVAAKALQKNLTLLAPLVLPYSEMLKFAQDLVLRKLGLRKGKAYQPDFRKAFQHFSLHAGGRGVIEGLGSQLKLSRRELEPSFASLYFYGNTSSASYFYGVAFAECHQGIRKGDRVWQVGFGSGFKVNSAVWRALRSFKDPSHVAWASVSTADVDTMWADLQSMGVKFVNGAIPPHVSAKKAATH